MKYYCDRCHKTFKWKNDIRRHLNRKTLCGPVNCLITIEYVKNKYGLSDDNLNESNESIIESKNGSNKIEKESKIK